MNNLTTRKIVLGLLMALVLVFSVQGIADALTFGTSRSGDLQTASEKQDFKITFSVSPASNTTAIKDNGNLIKDSTSTGGEAGARIDSYGYLVVEIDGSEYRTIETDPTGVLVIDPRPTYNDDTPNFAGSPSTPYYVDDEGNVVDSNGAAVYVQTGDGTRAGVNNNPPASQWRYTGATANPADKVPDANRYHYNQEQVTITLTDNTSARITKVGNVNIIPTLSHTLMETGTGGEQLSSRSNTLTLSAATAGETTITIADTTPVADLPDDASPSIPSITFTVYVVDDRNITAAATEWGFKGLTSDLYSNGGTDFADEAITKASEAADVRVEYKVVTGSGHLYVQKVRDDVTYKGSAVRTLSTSSAAEVLLDMNTSTNVVEASISGVAPRRGVFIFGYPTVAISGGYNQEGVFGGRLDDPLVVKVTDGRGKAISGLAAIFSTETGGSFIPVHGTTVYLDTNGDWAATYTADTVTASSTARETYPAAGDKAKAVQTDSRGEARIYYQLGDKEPQTVTVKAGGVDPITPSSFRFTEGSDERRPVLSILSGNNQRTDENGDIDGSVGCCRDTGWQSKT